MKIKLTAHIHFTKYSFQTIGEFQVFYCKLPDEDYRTYVGAQEVEIEVPDNYDPTAQQIAALEAKKVQAMTDYNKTVMDINTRISKLSALEYTA